MKPRLIQEIEDRRRDTQKAYRSLEDVQAELAREIYQVGADLEAESSTSRRTALGDKLAGLRAKGRQVEEQMGSLSQQLLNDASEIEHRSNLFRALLGERQSLEREISGLAPGDEKYEQKSRELVGVLRQLAFYQRDDSLLREVAVLEAEVEARSPYYTFQEAYSYDQGGKLVRESELKGMGR